MDPEQQPGEQGIDKTNIKFMVATTTMKTSGEMGSPMLSSFGKQTAVEMLEFQSPSKIQAESRYLESIIVKKGEKEITEEDSEEEF